MPYETDERLKGFLDTNQLLREQLCAALLSVDPRFSNLRAQHPRGGPDGGADITATYKLTLDAIAAVGFVNQATDSPTHRRSASKKFASDLERSLSRSRVPDAFVFFTNVSLTNTQKVKLTDMGYSAGLSHCDIIDREQMRLRLDSSEGLAIRYQRGTVWPIPSASVVPTIAEPMVSLLQVLTTSGLPSGRQSC